MYVRNFNGCVLALPTTDIYHLLPPLPFIPLCNWITTYCSSHMEQSLPRTCTHTHMHTHTHAHAHAHKTHLWVGCLGYNVSHGVGVSCQCMHTRLGAHVPHLLKREIREHQRTSRPQPWGGGGEREKGERDGGEGRGWREGNSIP